MKRFTVIDYDDHACVYDSANKVIYSMESNMAEADKRAKELNIKSDQIKIKERKNIDKILKKINERFEK